MTMNVVSGIPQAVNGHRHTISSMTEEWRVSLVVGDHGGAVKGSHYRDLLRARLGDDVTVSAGKMHLFLYAGSAKAAEELLLSHAEHEFGEWLAERSLVPYTMNGFPYGDFHEPVVKHKVYQPAWYEPARLHYTLQLAEILDQLLPPGIEGSISTLPIGWPAKLGSPRRETTAQSRKGSATSRGREIV